MDSTDAINPLGVGPDFEFHSEYRGDNHGGYEGSYRVLSSIEFDFDGVSITNVKRVGDYGTTHRDWEAKATLNLLFGELTVGEWSDTEEGTATSATGQSASQSSFSLSIASANPLVMTWAPEINATLNGTIASDGTLSLSYDTDLFPSHGIQVSRDGQVIHTAVTNNAERVKAQGAVGAANVGARLMMQENEGGITIPGDP